MAVLNHSGEEINAKIVYYGPGLSGKTTNLEFMHENMPAQSMGKLVSMKTRTDRTLFFDFLPMELGEINGYRTRFLLYTVPGQVYYNATRKLVLKGVDGVVFVADSSRAKVAENIDSLSNLEDNLNEHGLSLDHLPWVIQYNKRDAGDAMPIDELHQQLNLLGVPAFEAIAVQGNGVYETFEGVAGLVFDRLRSRLEHANGEDAAAAGTDTDAVTTAVDSALREIGEAGAPPASVDAPPPRPVPAPRPVKKTPVAAKPGDAGGDAATDVPAGQPAFGFEAFPSGADEPVAADTPDSAEDGFVIGPVGRGHDPGEAHERPDWMSDTVEIAVAEEDPATEQTTPAPAVAKQPPDPAPHDREPEPVPARPPSRPDPAPRESTAEAARPPVQRPAPEAARPEPAARTRRPARPVTVDVPVAIPRAALRENAPVTLRLVVEIVDE